MLDPIEAAKRLSDDLMMGYVSRPNGGGMTWNENREAADALIALVLAEARADGDATIATLRAAHDKTAEALVIAVQQALAAESQVTRLRAALDDVYRERNAVVAALIRTNGWPASLMAAPDEEGWWIVYAETPLGQVSWHVNPVDVRLFDDVPRRGADWDGHDTDTKYERIAMLARAALATAKEDR